MEGLERYPIYSETAKRLSVSIINTKFNMESHPDFKFCNKHILPFKDYLGFDILQSDDKKDNHMNVSYSGLERLIDKVRSELSSDDNCCLAVSIVSHGKIEEKDGKINHFLLCSSHKPGDQVKENQWFCTNDLVMRLRDCFKGPMIVFIQACRGDQKDIGTLVYQGEHQLEDLESGIGTMSLTTSSDEGGDTPASVTSEGPGEESSLPGGPSATSTSATKDDDQLPHEFAPMCPPDSVVAFASAHGHVSKSNNRTGGWMLASFDSAVEKLGHNEERSVLSLLTEANNYDWGMASMKTKVPIEKCIGSFQHKLVKELILKKVAGGGEDSEVEDF